MDNSLFILLIQIIMHFNIFVVNKAKTNDNMAGLLFQLMKYGEDVIFHGKVCLIVRI